MDDAPQHCDVNIKWPIEPMKIKAIGQQWAIDQSTVDTFAMSRNYFVNSQNVVYLLYWFYMGEKMMVYNNTCQ